VSGPRIAYVLTRFPKVSETFVVDELLGLERRGESVRVCALRPGRAEDAPEAAAALVRDCRCPSLGSPRLLAAQLHWALRRPRRLASIWLRTLVAHARSPRALGGAVVALLQAGVFARQLPEEGIEHVHAHWATHSALAAWALHRLADLPYSFTAHADDIYVRRPMLETKVGEAAFVVTISEYGRDVLLDQLLGQLRDPERAQIHVVHCGVDPAEFRPAPPPAAPRPFGIACVARLEPKKGHGVLLDACRELAERGLDFRCVLVGEGSLRSALERRLEDPRLRERVSLLGARSRDTVHRILQEAHVAALPCVVAADGRADGIPVALMEAMALGRPVVSTPVAGIPELVRDDESGLLVPAGDAGALADALARLAGDPALAARLAAGGRRRIESDFALARNVEQLAALFAGAAGPAREGARADARDAAADPDAATTKLRGEAGA